MKFLSPGDTIGVCAPSARFNDEKFQKGLDIVKQMGFKVIVPEDIFLKKRYLAGEDAFRAKVVEKMFVDPQIHGILCARGGFGAMRLLPYLNWTILKKHPTLFAGFSDNAALLVSLISRTGQAVIHGPTLLSLSDADPATVASFYDTLTGKPTIIPLDHIRCLIPGRCKGTLTGGNLATLAHLTGTPYQPDLKGKIFFFEDVGEPAYKIDRMLSQMKMAGLFDGLAGVLTGTFTNCDQKEYIDEILIETFVDFNIPVMGRIDAGHGPVNYSLLMGHTVNMDTLNTQLSWESFNGS